MIVTTPTRQGRTPARAGVSKILTNRDIDAARTYHATTKHSYTSVRTDGHHLDWDNRPMPYKLYPEVAGLALARDLRLARIPTLEAIAGGEPRRTSGDDSERT